MVLGIIVSAAVLALPDSSRLRPLSAELDCQLNLNEKVSTQLRVDGRGNYFIQDVNKDGFADDSRRLDLNLADVLDFNITPSLKARAGVSYGYLGSLWGQLDDNGDFSSWTSSIQRNRYGAFAEGKYIFNDIHSLVAKLDLSGNSLDSQFGRRDYDLSSFSMQADLKWLMRGDAPNAQGMGLRFSMDNVDEALWSDSPVLSVNNIESSISFLRAGYYVFNDYKFNERISTSAEVEFREDFGLGFDVTARAAIRWTPFPWMRFDAFAKRDLDRVVPMLKHFDALSTSKIFLNGASAMNHVLEDKSTFGASLKFVLGSTTELKLAACNTNWGEKSLVEYGAQTVTFYTLSDVGDSSPGSMPAIASRYRFSAELSSRPLGWLGLRGFGEWNESKMPLLNGEVVDEPMLNIWKAGAGATLSFLGCSLDVDAVVNGPARVWEFMNNLKYKGEPLYTEGKTPIWTLLNAKVSRDFGPVSVFVGGENLLGTTQSGLLGGAPGSAIISTPGFADFDASQIWAPMVGARVIAGIKVRIK